MILGRLEKIFLATIVLAGAVACGGGGGTVAEGGIGGTGMTVGTVTGFGSVFVNGVEFDTSQASITVDGVEQPVAGDTGALAVGMVVNVNGTVNADGVSGTATKVSFADELQGPVSANNVLSNGTLTVFGQIIQIRPDTVYVPGGSGYLTLDSIVAGAVIEVSGYSDGLGTVVATRIEVKSGAGLPWELKGVITNLDTMTTTFTLGAQEISYVGVSPPSLLADGLYVEVTTDGTIPSGGPLAAASIQLVNGGVKGLNGTAGDYVELEGVVTTTLNGGIFSVNGQQVITTADTQYQGGIRTDLASLGKELEVIGTLDALNRLVAKTIEFRLESSIEMEAPVAGVDTVAGTINVLGLDVAVNSLTLVLDDTGTLSRPLNLSQLIQHQVDLHVSRDANGRLVATSLEVLPVPPNPLAIELQGAITRLPQLEVEGVPVDSTLQLPVGAGVGTRVDVSGSWGGATITATSITLWN